MPVTTLAERTEKFIAGSEDTIIRSYRRYAASIFLFIVGMSCARTFLVGYLLPASVVMLVAGISIAVVERADSAMLILLAVLGAGLLCTRLSAMRRLDLDAAFLSIARKAGLTLHSDDACETRRMDLLRTIIGSLYVARYVQIAWVAVFMDYGTPHQWAVYAAVTGGILCGLFLAVGFLTPLAAVACSLLSLGVFDEAVWSYNLGTEVFLMMCLSFVLMPCGTTLSLDSWLARHSPSWGRIILPLYRLVGRPSVARSALGRTLTLLSYGMLCIYSVLFHIHDPAWIGGYANLQALTSSFLSPHYEWFRVLYDTSPTTSIWMSKITIWLMMVWELLLLPLVVISYNTRRIAIGWGLLFFLVSLFLLDLSYLPYFEFLLWALLFWQRWKLNVADNERLELFFDDRCNLCDRTLRFLLRIDVFSVIDPKPLSQNTSALRMLGISPEAGSTDLYGHDPKTSMTFGGYDLYLELARRLLLLVPLYPLLWALRAARIGPAVYRAIADRRIKWFGICVLSRVPPRLPSEQIFGGEQLPKRTWLQKTILVAYGISLAHFVLWLHPWAGRFIPHGVATLSRAFLFDGSPSLGLAPINVFNKTDLLMESHFVTATRINKDGSSTLLPLLNRKGARLKLNKSDRIQFGLSIWWRRSMLVPRPYCFEQRKSELKFFMRPIINYDEVWNHPDAKYYRFDYYFQEPWNYNLVKNGVLHRFTPYFICSVMVAPDGAYLQTSLKAPDSRDQEPFMAIRNSK